MLGLDYNEIIKKHAIPEKAKFYQLVRNSSEISEVIFYDEHGKNLYVHPYFGEL